MNFCILGDLIVNDEKTNRLEVQVSLSPEQSDLLDKYLTSTVIAPLFNLDFKFKIKSINWIDFESGLLEIVLGEFIGKKACIVAPQDGRVCISVEKTC